jgi:hypothetical protein
VAWWPGWDYLIEGAKGMLAAKSNVVSRMRQPPSKDNKLVAAAELANFKPNSKQRKTGLRKMRPGGSLGH